MKKSEKKYKKVFSTFPDVVNDGICVLQEKAPCHGLNVCTTEVK